MTNDDDDDDDRFIQKQDKLSQRGPAPTKQPKRYSRSSRNHPPTFRGPEEDNHNFPPKCKAHTGPGPDRGPDRGPYISARTGVDRTVHESSQDRTGPCKKSQGPDRTGPVLVHAKSGEKLADDL